MSRDLTAVGTAELQAEYDATLAKIRDLRASLNPLNIELSKRSNTAAFLRNSIMSGQKASLQAAGVSKEAIAEAERWVAEERALVKALRESDEVSP